MNPEKFLSRAEKQFNAKNYDAALKTLDELKILAPNYKEAYSLEALIFSISGRLVEEY